MLNEPYFLNDVTHMEELLAVILH